MFPGSAPLTAVPLAASWNEEFIRGVAVACALYETLGVADAADVQAVLMSIDGLSFEDAMSFQSAVTAAFQDSLALAESCGVGLPILLADSLSLADDLDTAIGAALLASEILSFADGGSTQANVLQALTETLALREVLIGVADLTLEETLGLADDLDQSITADMSAHETLAMADELRHAITFFLRDGVALGDSATLSIAALLELSDGIAFVANLPLDDGDYQAWVMNADTAGVTSYTNFPMESLFVLDGVPYGLTSTGLYRLEGDDDAGESIAWRVATGDLNFGTGNQKNVPRAYLYLLQSGQVVLKTIVSERGSRRETYYELESRASDGGDDIGLRTVPLGRGVRGVWWQFEVSGTGPVNLDGAEVLSVVLSRRG